MRVQPKQAASHQHLNRLGQAVAHVGLGLARARGAAERLQDVPKGRCVCQQRLKSAVLLT